MDYEVVLHRRSGQSSASRPTIHPTSIGAQVGIIAAYCCASPPTISFIVIQSSQRECSISGAGFTIVVFHSKSLQLCVSNTLCIDELMSVSAPTTCHNHPNNMSNAIIRLIISYNSGEEEARVENVNGNYSSPFMKIHTWSSWLRSRNKAQFTCVSICAGQLELQ